MGFSADADKVLARIANQIRSGEEPKSLEEQWD